MATTYSFPVLPYDELMPCLRELDLTVTEAELVKPTADIVRSLFEQVLGALKGVTTAELSTPQLEAVQLLEYPELHEESVANLAMCRHLTELLAASGVSDFGLRDLHKPDPTRLRRILSAIINFARYRQEKLVFHDELQSRIAGLIAAHDQLQAESCALTEEVAVLEAQQAAERAEAAEVQHRVAEQQARNAAAVKQHEATAQEGAALKRTHAELSAQVADARLAVGEAQREEEQLKMQVVESPEKLAAALESLQDAVEAGRRATAEQERAARELTAAGETMAKASREVAKATTSLSQLETDIAAKKTVSKKVKEVGEEMEAAEAELQKLTLEQQHLSRLHSSMTERLERLDSQQSAKGEAAQWKVEEQQMNKAALEAELAANSARSAENAAATRGLRERMAELQAAHEAKMGAVREQMGELQAHLGRYHFKLFEAMRGEAAAG